MCGRSPESGDVWYTSKQMNKTICATSYGSHHFDGHPAALLSLVRANVHLTFFPFLSGIGNLNNCTFRSYHLYCSSFSFSPRSCETHCLPQISIYLPPLSARASLYSCFLEKTASTACERTRHKFLHLKVLSLKLPH